jgi:hypothetical protein
MTTTAKIERVTGTWRSRAPAVVCAAAIPMVIWTVTVALIGHRLLVTNASGTKPPLDITLPLVTVFALAAGLIGWGLLAVLERFTRRAATIWTVLAGFMFLISFLPLTGPGTPVSTRLVLGSMHVAVAAVLIPVFSRTGRTSGATPDPRDAT